MEISEIRGLSDEEVAAQIAAGKTNNVKIVSGKSYFQIFKDNVLTFFNIVLFVIAGFLIYFKFFGRLFFLVILIANIIIGLYEDITARRLMDKMKISTDPNAFVVRNGKRIEIKATDIVESDIVVLSLGSKICVDGKLISGSITVNESLLTGEPDDVIKKEGDQVMSGTYVTSGTAYIVAEKVGKESYSSQLSTQAKKFKRSPSVILKSLRGLFRIIGAVVIVLGASTIIVYAVQGTLFNDQLRGDIGALAGSLVGMVPCGLYLLTSTALAVAVISLSRKGARVQDFYSVEMLARTTTLCIDKTGTITDGTMDVVKAIYLSTHQQREIRHIISDLLKATKDTNATAKSLTKKFNLPVYYETDSAIAFNSANKYSAVRFTNKDTYVLGAPEFINYESNQKITKQIEDNAKLGYRVLLLAKNNKPFKDNKVQGVFEPVCLIVLKDNIKPNVKETLEWFKQNNVKVKVISGDNALTVSKIASYAGVEEADKYISLEGKSNEEVKQLATEYNVFGRVTPEQKEIIIRTLKESGEKVAMTGDGVNDILALKVADCSIAMANGADSARDTSHIVLLDNDFDSLPKVVAEGRRVINNLQRTCSLFLVKTLFTVIFTFTFLIVTIATRDSSVRYPFPNSYMHLWEFASVGISSFFLALQPNSEAIKGDFIKNILKKAIPAGATIVLCTAVPFIMYLMQCGGIFTDVDSIGKAASIGAIIFTIVGMFVLLKVCTPLDKYRAMVFGISVVINVVGLLLCIMFSLNHFGFNFLEIDFNLISPTNWVTVIATSVVGITAYFIFYKIGAIAKGQKHENGI